MSSGRKTLVARHGTGVRTRPKNHGRGGHWSWGSRRRHQGLEESTGANTNNKIKHYNKKESGKPKGAREFDPAQTPLPKRETPLSNKETQEALPS
ncbi:hypothetical protein J6590_072458 [Homalodisca vitripennis]|nr:hypothetical protein J6590_072458 [Homalodisca vitripennis]